jgi:hypothetical protein
MPSKSRPRDMGEKLTFIGQIVAWTVWFGLALVLMLKVETPFPVAALLAALGLAIVVHIMNREPYDRIRSLEIERDDDAS